MLLLTFLTPSLIPPSQSLHSPPTSLTLCRRHAHIPRPTHHSLQMSHINDTKAQPPNQADEPEPSNNPPIRPSPPPNTSFKKRTSFISWLLSALDSGPKPDDRASPHADATLFDLTQRTDSDSNTPTNMSSTQPDSHPSVGTPPTNFASDFSTRSSPSTTPPQPSNSTHPPALVDMPDDTTAKPFTEYPTSPFSWLRSALNKAVQPPKTKTDSPSPNDDTHAPTQPITPGGIFAADVSVDDSVQTNGPDISSGDACGSGNFIDDAATEDPRRPFPWLVSTLKTSTERSKSSDAALGNDASDQDTLAERAASSNDSSTNTEAAAEDLRRAEYYESRTEDAHTDDEISDDVIAEEATPRFSWLFSALSIKARPTKTGDSVPADGVLDEGTLADQVTSTGDTPAIAETPNDSSSQCTGSDSSTGDSPTHDERADDAVTGNSTSPFFWVMSALDRNTRPSDNDDSPPSDDALDENICTEKAISCDDASSASDTPTKVGPQCTDPSSSKKDAPGSEKYTDNAATEDSTPPFAWLLSLLSANAEPSETMTSPPPDDALGKDEIAECATLPDDSTDANDTLSDSDSSSVAADTDAAVNQDSAFPFPWLFSVFENGTRTPSKKLRELLQSTPTDLSQQAAVTALRAVGLEPFDTASEELDVSLPRRPFDPVLALVLAGYAFRAYYDPPRSAHYEAFVVPIAGSLVSGLERQLVHTEFAYMDASFIACRADGMFMLHVCEVKGLDEVYATAEVNSTIVGDIVSKRSASVLRIRDAYSASVCEMLEREEDMLILNLFTSKRDHEEGKSPTHSASVGLAELANEGIEKGTRVDGDRIEVFLEKVLQEEKNRDFFHFSLLPKELKLPFQREGSAPRDANAYDEKNADSPFISIQVSFVPFPKGAEDKKAGTSELLRQRGESTSATIPKNFIAEDPTSKEHITSLLAEEPPPGQLPNPEDWSRLASVAKSVIKQIGEFVGFERSGNVTENLPGSVFIESLSTDTEVWLFHDEAEKSIVISFRGTEQGSWRDFFTDAQVFLQRWAPGEDVNLNVNINNTVGLSDLVPDILPNAGSSIPEDASAVHYGFLRAFLSIRDAVTRGINLLSSDLSEGYSLHFTGHSLGGALAILTAADFQAKHLFDNHNVTCMSFGAPKVGNIHFAKLYNRLVPNSFRIVNDADLVSRMPRSLRSGNPLGRYKHAGRTVLVNEDGDYWIEGHVDTRSFQRMTSLEDPFRERYKNLSDLLAFEQGLWSELLSGRAVQHHMENSYFTAMQRVLQKTVDIRLV